MKTDADKEHKYWEKWAIRRVNKWRYILKQGVLYWVMPLLVMDFLFDKRTYTLQWEIRVVFIKLAVGFVVGLVWGYLWYRGMERGYKFFLNSERSDPTAQAK